MKEYLLTVSAPLVTQNVYISVSRSVISLIEQFYVIYRNIFQMFRGVYTHPQLHYTASDQATEE